MTQEMDRVCSTIIVAAAVILLCMGYVEMMKMKVKYSGNGSVCGMKAQTEDATSAKKAVTFNENRTGKKVNQYLTISEDWPLESQEEVHKQLEDKVDTVAFFWRMGC